MLNAADDQSCRCLWIQLDSEQTAGHNSKGMIPQVLSKSIDIMYAAIQVSLLDTY